MTKPNSQLTERQIAANRAANKRWREEQKRLGKPAYKTNSELTDEQIEAKRARHKRWRDEQKLIGRTIQRKPKSDEQMAKAAARQRATYVPRVRKPKDWTVPDNWKRRTLNSARHRAKKRGMEFNITVDDIIIPQVCPVLGIKLQVNNGVATRKNGDSPSLDRINNALGYIKGNVRVISARANHLKSDATIEEIRAVYDDFVKIFPKAPGWAHINQHHIKANAADGGNRPVVTIKRGKTTRYAREAIFHGNLRLRYDGTVKSCGARCWMEFTGDVTLIDEMTYTEASEAA